MWENISNFDIHLSQCHSPLSTLSFTDMTLMLPFPCISIAGKVTFKKSCQLATLSLQLSSLYQLVQVIITLTAFSWLYTQPKSFIQRRVLRQSTPQSPRHFNLLSSARLHTGVDWRMQASCRSSSLCQDSYLSQSCQWCDWQPVRGSTHLLLPLPWVEPTTRLKESRHDVWAPVPRPRDNSCGWYCDIFYDWMHVVSHDPSKKICGNGVNAMVLMPTTQPHWG